jgi:dihydrofolate reductase
VLRFRIFVGMTVDGFIAPANNVPAWDTDFNPRSYGYEEFIKEIKVIVLGRTTFDQVLGFDKWP